MSEGQMLEIAAIWENTAKSGKKYYSGSLGKTKILMFPVNSDNPKAPKFKICLAPREEDEDSKYNKDNNAAADREQPRGGDGGSQGGPNDDDIPF